MNCSKRRILFTDAALGVLPLSLFPGGFSARQRYNRLHRKYGRCHSPVCFLYERVVPDRWFSKKTA